MLKGRGSQPSGAHEVEQQPGRKQGNPWDSNHAFVRAFADALRDILHDDEPASRSLSPR